MNDALAAALDACAAHDRVLVASDFDGVLAPIVLDPMAARPTTGTIELLRALATRAGVTVAVVSGRDLATLRTLTGIGESEPIVLVGSHGGQSSRPLDLDTELTDAHRDLLARARAALEPVAQAHRGTNLEHKPAGVVLHTRRADPDVAADAVCAAQQATAGLAGLGAMHGKQILEFTVLPVTKGSALLALARQTGSQATCYLGDDVTDENAFAVLDAGAGHVTIKVGPGDTVAAHRIDAPDEVPAVLRRLLDARA